MWLIEPERYQVWAALLSCGHYQWLFEPRGMTIDEGASLHQESRFCFQCRYYVGRRIHIPRRAFQAARPAFATLADLNRARADGLIPRVLRWR